MSPTKENNNLYLSGYEKRTLFKTRLSFFLSINDCNEPQHFFKGNIINA